ncbi:hypothetical protein GCM10010339_80440 [Streptomyces alanosinicus]|uniref:Uncharacterized protein n=1 Tax=Streptomyces alanosinicus TaxID=68171 RepID=A0A918YRU8_9ACTN|nr:hypothetical protein GCM10010339_80440 [Streptomyces alanosinicus]
MTDGCRHRPDCATDAPQHSQAYRVGGGIAALAAAAFLMHGGRFSGENIHILKELSGRRRSMDGCGGPSGYVPRGGRMLEDEACACLWNLLETIPTLTDATVSVREEIREFSATWPTQAKARLIGKGATVPDASDYGLDARDRVELPRLPVLPEAVIGARRIEDFALACRQSCQTALDLVEGAGRGSGMDALAGRAALDVCDVRLQGLVDVLPCLRPSRFGEDQAVDESAEGGAVAGAPQVVVDGSVPGVVVQVDLPHLSGSSSAG